MNLSKPLRTTSRRLQSILLQCRPLLPRQKCNAFSDSSDPTQLGIGPIFVINLDRQPVRWTDMERELGCIVDASYISLSKRVVRYAACDARSESLTLDIGREVDPEYTLADQLFVEPQPLAIPDEFDLERPIAMSRAEIAVASSHIGVWKAIAQSDSNYSLVLEDDVWFAPGFGHALDQAWREMHENDRTNPAFDILYLSYMEVRHGAPKELVSKNIFRPERGLWCLSGYVLSKKGAQALLELLPCRGPIDLWINHKYRELDVRALRRSVVNQRRDLRSTNSYSILPTLSRIGVLEHSDSSLFQRSPIQSPVFGFGPPGSGMSSLAMALSMLGYRCCSDLDSIPDCEFRSLTAGRAGRAFDAYVNVGSLSPQISVLTHRYPSAKYILIDDPESPTDPAQSVLLSALEGKDVLHMSRDRATDWRALCEHLKLAPPDARYPSIRDIGIRTRRSLPSNTQSAAKSKRLRHDRSPWVAKRRAGWIGTSENASAQEKLSNAIHVCFEDDFTQVDSTRWQERNDTFPGNLGLFRPANVTMVSGAGVSLTVCEESLGVRGFSAAAISSRAQFLYGRFEATFQATNIPGLVTGFFLHRNSPRQEIDIEILGNQPSKLLVNVFYNPGTEGAKFDYGYRGSPTLIDLGFDASEAPHVFAIEWTPHEIRWFVGRKLVHRRASWDPTPIPHLPMTLHVNTWPTSSRELAGRLARRSLPASASLRRVGVELYRECERGSATR